MLHRKRLRGADIAGRDAVHADPPACQLHRKPAHQPDHARLRCRVVHVLVPAIRHPHDRGERNDRACAALAHHRQRRPHHAEDAFQIHIQRGIPPGIVELGERHPVSDAGIGDHDVEPAEALRRRRDHRVDAGRVGHVEMEERRCAAIRLDCGRNVLPLGVQDVGHRHRVASLRERARGRLADADAAAGDQNARFAHLVLSVVLHRRPAATVARAGQTSSQIPAGDSAANAWPLCSPNSSSRSGRSEIWTSWPCA